MLAIVTIAGQQFKVSEGQTIYVHQLEAAAGDSVSFDNVLMTIGTDGTVKVSTPTSSVASVKATVLGHQKGDKVVVFKKKRRKGYRKKNGHRQSFTQIKIDSITI
jgi:large subunit ribosomal protein L21